MEARSRIRKNMNDGKSVSDKLAEIKKMASASAFLNGVTRLCKDVFCRVKCSVDKVIRKQAEARHNTDEAYHVLIQGYHAIMALQIPPPPGALFN